MVEMGSEREKNIENNGGLTAIDSIESRWVFQDEYDSDMDSGDHGTADGDEGSTPRNELELDSDDDDDNAMRKLIRTGPRIDSFDALELPGAQRNDFDGHQIAKPHYEGLGKSGGDEGEKTGAHFRKSIWIHAGRSTTKVIHLVRRLVEKYRERKRDLHMMFIDLEKAYDSPEGCPLQVFGVYLQDVSAGRKILLAFQTLGVVFGDVGTSPLYTFSVMFSKAPVNGNEDVLGALSLVLYTLILISLVKYVLIVLWANDDGEGGTFALYSLLCRHAKVNLLPNQLASDARVSGFRLKVPSPELERSLKIKERLEASLTLKKLLLMLVLAGTAMVIADGVVTPAMSVMSAVGGLRVGVSGVKQDQVVMISVAFLVILFSVQKYGTSKMGHFVGPALFIWFCSLGGIGVYNLIKYDSSVWKAFNPVHIYYYFKRNSTKAWYSLGGCILCATGKLLIMDASDS
ncbi:hypothetical protein MTR67_044238 [Solanum verrucosum]|uniref:K+ potassium transporter integral membrane domain-containing protein n=1 Tax=Solanum verrucosum TaxID=315347 RepID=A0AAF0ZV42_SOLVR|nr:hypothetical protein MTR67_044238 [Solanum verrucosum]